MKTLLIGLLAGAAIGYFLATEDKEGLINDAKDAVDKAKDFIADGVHKGKATLAAAKEKIPTT